MVLDDGRGLSTRQTEYTESVLINELRAELDIWRRLPNPEQWQVSPVTRHLLQRWRILQADAARPIRPFFCQVEAVETAIWLAEVAPKSVRGKRFVTWLREANAGANPDLFRVAMKLATGAGKTTVMAMLIAWQTLNAARSPGSKLFSRGFLIVTPGITIKDRLRVLMPSDPENIYQRLDLIPADLAADLGKAEIVITNYHALRPQERISLARGTREALRGHGEELRTLETEGQMLVRVMPQLLGLGQVIAINDEAHHCYRERAVPEQERLTGDDRKEAEENREAARLWISGLEALNRHVGLRCVYDLSATPFFLAGSGYLEGTLFPWVSSDFSLMDAIECGIVKLPRVPVADNLPGQPQPLYRNLWPAIGKRMPKKQRGEVRLDPGKLPIELKAALDALYGHYAKTYDVWAAEGMGVPPVFIVVCNNTTNSELVRDYIAGYERETDDGTIEVVQGQCDLFRNFSDDHDRLARPRTILIDSAALEAGGDVDPAFRAAHATEIAAFKAENARRGETDALTDADILRELMNTVGRKGKLGEQVRCVVSVSMLTEGWDANNVTHILGLRAFGTKLICEQVMGRALRRMSYEADPETGLFRTEYADIMGIDGLNFASQPVIALPQPPREIVQVRAVTPERDALEIVFPRVEGYRIDFPEERLEADFTGMEPYVLTPEKVSATEVLMAGVVGETETLTQDHLGKRRSTVAMELAKHLVFHKLRDPNGAPRIHLIPRAKAIANRWLESRLVCKGGAQEAQILYHQLRDEACDLILGALIDPSRPDPIHRAVLDPFTPEGSTLDVTFNTSKADRWLPRPDRSHVNWIVLDSDWEGELCRLIEDHPSVLAYAKNHNLGFEIPYLREAEPHRYRPDFLLRLDAPDPVTLVLEVKGYRGHDAMLKAETMRARWIPAVNRLGTFGRWGFAELREIHDFRPALDAAINAMLDVKETA